MILYFCIVGKKIIFLEGIGECVFVKSKRSKKIRIKVEPHEPVTTHIPYFVSYDTAYQFVSTKKEWIKKAKSKISEIENQRTSFTPETEFSTLYHKLSIGFHQKPKLTARINKGIIKISCPNDLEINNPEVQEFIRKAITETFRREAKQILPKKLNELAIKHHFQYNNVTIKNLKSRWGSCSSKNNINLNLHLVRLPEHLMEYVLVHELVHTIHKNHGITFWRTLDKHVGNARELQRELRAYSLEF